MLWRRTGGLQQGRRSARGSHKRQEWAGSSENVQPHAINTADTTTVWRRYGEGCPSTGTAGKIGGGDRQPPVGQRAQGKRGGGGGRDNMNLLRTGSRNLGRRGSRNNHMRVPIPCLPRRVCTRQLHAGTSGSPRERVCRPEAPRRVPPRGDRGKTTPPPGGACQRPANGRAWEKVGGATEHHVIRRPPSTGCPRTGAVVVT